MSIDVNVQNDLVIVTETTEDIVVNVSNAAGPQGPAGQGVPVGGSTNQVLKKLSATNYDTYWAADVQGVPYSGASGSVNLGPYDLTVNELTIGKGLNGVANNTALGKRTLFHNTTGNYNTAVGHEAGHNLTTGQYNTAIGQSAMFTATTAGQNTAIGVNALLLTTSGGSNVAVGLDTLQHITTGSSNTAIGYNAGSHITGGSTPNTTATNSVFIGRDSKAAADGQTNQIVIGQNAVGNGSNTATFGNTATTANYFTGSVNGGSFVKSGGTSSQFLMADGSTSTLTNPVTGTGTTNYLPKWTSGSAIGNSAITDDGTTVTLISRALSGTSATFSSSVTAGDTLSVTSSTSTSYALNIIGRTTAGNASTINFFNNAASTRYGFLYVDSSTFEIGSITGSNIPLVFSTNQVERARLTSAGRLLLGTTTESTYLLDVNGTARVSGNLTVTGVIYTDAVATRSGASIDFRDQTAASIMYLDATNKRVGIGITTPSYKLHVVGTSALFQNAGTFELDLLNTTSGNYLRAVAGATDSNIGTIQNIPFSFIMNGTRVGQFTSTNGNLILQNGGTFTDAGFRLDVNGTARVSGSTYLATSSGSVGIGVLTPLNLLQVNQYYNQSIGAGTPPLMISSTASVNQGALFISTAVGTVPNANKDALNLVYFKNGAINGGSANINFDVHDGGNGLDKGIVARITGGQTDGINTVGDGFLSFATASSLSSTPTERLRIVSTGAATFSSSVTASSFIKSGGTSSQYLMADGSVTTGSALTITNRQTASYTLALTDADKLVEMNVATANNLTVPLNSSVAFAIGTKIDLAQYGAGQTTVVATSGVTVRSAGGALKLAVQYSGASLVKIATDEWYLFGDITV